MKKGIKYFLFAFVLPIVNISIYSQDRTKYIWETPISYDVNAPAELISQLRKEADTILKYPSLAPLRVFFGDVIFENYFSYLEPARVITTLARAYRYLTPSQRERVKNYIRTLLQHPQASPWNYADINNMHLDRRAGKRREYHRLHTIWGYDDRSHLGWRPVLHILYGIWLYAYNSKDYDLIRNNWNQIRQYYNAFSSREIKLLSGLGAAIAMARMAYIANDNQTLQSVFNQINANMQFTGLLQSAMNFAYNGNQGWDAPYPYNTDRARDLIFMGWIYLNITPEICRFLDDYYRQEVIQHHTNEVSKYPLWWIRSVPYWSRWTGDESIGLPSEVCGMASPIERWIMKKTAGEFYIYTRSSPYCIGDSYWIEMLIDAIEIYGKISWKDVRTYSDNTPPNRINDLRVEYVNSKGYLIWTTPSDDGLLGAPFSYDIRYSNSQINEQNWNSYQKIEYNMSIKKAGETDTLKINYLGPDSIYYIAIKAVDDFGNASTISNQAIFNSKLVNFEDIFIPKEFYVYPAYPNPFNPSTQIKFNIPETSKATIKVYNSMGEEIEKLEESKEFLPGIYTIKWAPVKISSGIYYIRFSFSSLSTSKTYTKTIKAALIK